MGCLLVVGAEATRRARGFGRTLGLVNLGCNGAQQFETPSLRSFLEAGAAAAVTGVVMAGSVGNGSANEFRPLRKGPAIVRGPEVDSSSGGTEEHINIAAGQEKVTSEENAVIKVNQGCDMLGVKRKLAPLTRANRGASSARRAVPFRAAVKD